MALPFHVFGEGDIMDTQQMLKNLTSFRVAFCSRQEDTLALATERGVCRRVLRKMVCLQDLALLFMSTRKCRRDPETLFDFAIVCLRDILGDAHFSKLRTFLLQGFWLGPEELCAFLQKHSATMEDLNLADVALGGFPPFAWNGDGLALTPLDAGREGSVESSSAWESVARVCQEMPKLGGLQIRSCGTDMDGSTLAARERLRLINRGMNGRPNKYDARLEGAEGDPLVRKRLDDASAIFSWMDADLPFNA